MNAEQKAKAKEAAILVLAKKTAAGASTSRNMVLIGTEALENMLLAFADAAVCIALDLPPEDKKA